MEKRRLIILGILCLAVPLCYYIGTIGTSSPAAQATRLQHSGLGQVDHWTVDVALQDYRTIAGGQSSLPAEPAYDRKAALKATIITSGKAQGRDWLQTCHFETIQKAEYSWKRVETRATLLTLWDSLTGPNGGLRSLKVRVDSSSPWLQAEVLTPLNAAIWPELPDAQIAPGQSWESSVPVQITAKELSQPLAFSWKCRWNWRLPVPGSSQNVATLDFQANASAPAQGQWSGEVLYSVPDQRVVGARGTVKLSFNAPTGQPDMALVEAVQFNYELLRWLPGSTGKTPAGSPPGAQGLSGSPVAPQQTP